MTSFEGVSRHGPDIIWRKWTSMLEPFICVLENCKTCWTGGLMCRMLWLCSPVDNSKSAFCELPSLFSGLCIMSRACTITRLLMHRTPLMCSVPIWHFSWGISDGKVLLVISHSPTNWLASRCFAGACYHFYTYVTKRICFGCFYSCYLLLVANT